MVNRRLLIVALLSLAGFVSSACEAADKPRVLMVTESQGFRHGSVTRKDGQLAPAEVAMTQLGQQSGLFEIHCSQDCAADFTAENLKNYDIVMFYTTGVLPISDAARDYFVNEWLKQPGHGVIGFHSATDTYRTTEPGHRWYQELIGGTFNGHPWNANNTVTISVHDTKFPGMQAFDEEFQIKDEIYQYVNWVPENVHVLMSLNMAKCKPQMDYHVPIAWARQWGAGKIYYTNLGHNESTWTDKRFVDSVTHAVRWVLDLEEGDATPNPDVSAAQEAKAKTDAGAAK